MSRIGAAVLSLVLCLPASVLAAEITRIASSGDPKDPFGMFIDVGFVRTQRRTKIVREYHQNGAVQDVSELQYLGLDMGLSVDARIGLWEDLELKVAVPFLNTRTQRWRYAAGTNASNSTIANNCLGANGELLDPSCPTTLAGSRPLFPVTSNGPNTTRSGVGDITFGLAYALFNQKRDDTKPTWILGLDYTAPTAERLVPYDLSTDPTSTGGKIGERIHRYKLYTTFSRKLGSVEPYFQVHYTLPVRGPGWYSNCENPNSSMGRPENCNTPQWDRSQTGIRPPHVAGFVVGSEFNPSGGAQPVEGFAFDLRALGNFVSEGRYYNEMSDLFGKLLYTGSYLQVGGRLGFVVRPADVFHFRFGGTLLYNSDHTLTGEAIGRDVVAPLNGQVDITQYPIEVNPNFDWRTDMVSRRFRATESFTFGADVSVSLNF